MSGSLNKVMLIGNLGRDPEIRSTNDGKQIAVLALATSETWRDKNTKERKTKTEWHKIVVFSEGLVANVIKPYLKKGSKIFIEGMLRTNKWQDNEQKDRYTTAIQLQGFNGVLTLLDSSGANSSTMNSDPISNINESEKNFDYSELDDDIPF
ncbi:MAG: single-stranded DNA-binding protein [Rickettsiaceae bacterium]